MNYPVQVGDTPASIAMALTGDPARAMELIAANPYKPRVVWNGMATFRELRAGEMLALPPYWGQVPRGAPVVPAAGYAPFARTKQTATVAGEPGTVGRPGDGTLGQAVNVPGSITAGQATVISGTGFADGDVNWTSSLGATIDPNPSTSANGSTAINYTAPAAGTDTLTATDSAGTSASAQVTVVSASPNPPSPGGGNPALTSAAVLAAAAAMNQVPDFTSPAACGPVKAFQSAWNAAGGTPTLTVDGGYGTETAAANAQVAAANGGGNVPAGLTTGFPSCGAAPPPTPPMPVPMPPSPVPGPPSPPSSSSSALPWIVAGAVVLIGGGAIAYAASRRRAAERTTTTRRTTTRSYARE